MDEITETNEVVMFYKEFWDKHKEEVVFGAAIVASTVFLNAIMTKRIMNGARVQIDLNTGASRLPNTDRNVFASFFGA